MEEQQSMYPEWEYRMVRHKLTEEEIKNAPEDTTAEWYSLQEVYLDEDGVAYAHSIDLMTEGETVDDMKLTMQDMMKAFDLPVVDEMPELPAQGESEDIQDTIREEVRELKPLPTESSEWELKRD